MQNVCQSNFNALENDHAFFDIFTMGNAISVHSGSFFLTMRTMFALEITSDTGCTVVHCVYVCLFCVTGRTLTDHVTGFESHLLTLCALSTHYSMPLCLNLCLYVCLPANICIPAVCIEFSAVC